LDSLGSNPVLGYVRPPATPPSEDGVKRSAIDVIIDTEEGDETFAESPCIFEGWLVAPYLLSSADIEDSNLNFAISVDAEFEFQAPASTIMDILIADTHVSTPFLDVPVAATLTKTAGISLAVATDDSIESSLNVYVTDIAYRYAHMSAYIRGVFFAETDLEVSVAATDEITSSLDVNITV